MELIELLFNVFQSIVGIFTIVSIFLLIFEFRNSNRLGIKESYLKLFDSISNHLKILQTENKELLNNKSYNSIFRYLLLISFNIKPKKLKSLNIFLSKMLEMLFKPVEKLKIEDLKSIENQFREILNEYI